VISVSLESSLGPTTSASPGRTTAIDATMYVNSPAPVATSIVSNGRSSSSRSNGAPYVLLRPRKTEFPHRPGIGVPRRWPGPFSVKAASEPWTITVDRPIFGIVSTPTGWPSAGIHEVEVASWDATSDCSCWRNKDCDRS